MYRPNSVVCRHLPALPKVALPLVAGLALGVLLLAAAPGEAGAQGESLSALVRAHRDAEALERLGSLETSAAHEYLRGRLLARSWRLPEAVPAYRAALAREQELPEPVRADLRFRLGRALLRSGDAREAASELEAAAAERGSRGALARALRAEALFEAGVLEEAIPALRQVAREDARDVDTFAVRLALADALAPSDRAAAVAELRALLVTRPSHPDLELARARLEALHAEVELTRAEHLARAERLLRHARASEAFDELRAAGEGHSRAERVDWWHRAGMALYRARRYREAHALLRRAARARSAHQVADALHAARALARDDRDMAAVSAFRRLVRRWPRSPEASRAEYLAAWLELRHRRPLGAAHMRAFLRGPRATPERTRSARWQLAMDAYARGHFREASRLFAQYASLGSGAMFEGRGRYWQARSMERAHDRRAADLYRQAMALAPLHWYGLLAAARLRAMGQVVAPPFGEAVEELPEPTPPSEVPFAGTSLERSPLALELRFYAGLGLVEDAVRVLRARERSVRRSLGDAWRPVLIRTYAALGEWSRPYQLAITPWRGLGRAPRVEDAWLWSAAWPRPEREAVLAAARQRGVSPALVYAVMRQESGYNPHAVSPPGAIGLLQVMPSAGERIARQLGRPFDEERLFDPDENIRLGTKEIASVLERFDGIVPLALAAYNAGARRVHQWLERSPGADLDLFVEQIPFDETRNYVRRVTSHYLTYRYLDDPSRGWSVELPERVPGPVD